MPQSSSPWLPLALIAEALTAYAVILHILEMFWIVGLAAWGLVATGSSLQDSVQIKRLSLIAPAKPISAPRPDPRRLQPCSPARILSPAAHSRAL